jgi:1,4-dihydroxy-2-naphthoate octaprenyltransferase
LPEARLSGAIAPGRSAVRFAAATRARGLSVVLLPFAIGAALAWDRTGRFSWAWFAPTVVAAALGRLALNLLEEVLDDASGADAAARADGLSAPTGSGAIASGQMTRGRATAIVIVLFGASLACWSALGAARTWRVLIVAAIAYAAEALARPPFVREIVALGSAGVLAVAVAYGAQTRAFDAAALRAGIVPGIMLMLILFHQSFLRHRSDRQIGRPNAVSLLGPRRAIVASAVVLALAIGLLLWQVARREWPAWAAVAVVGSLPLLAAYKRLAEEPESIHVQLPFLGAAVGSAAVVNVVLALSLCVDAVRR